MSLGAADQEGHVRHGIVTPAGQAVGEGWAVQNLAATIERDQRGTGRGGCQQKLALAQHELAGWQLLLFLELAQRERPADAVGVVVVEIALGAAPSAADAGYRQLHVKVTPASWRREH